MKKGLTVILVLTAIAGIASLSLRWKFVKSALRDEPPFPIDEIEKVKPGLMKSKQEFTRLVGLAT